LYCSWANILQIQDLGLVDNVLYAKKTAAGSKNRFIYYPDRLNRLPSPGAGPDFVNLFSLAQSGLMGGVYQALFEAFKPKRPDSLTDESIGSFIARRVDRRLADNLVSAVMHGIYAGDVWQLSARTLLEKAWTLEGQDGSIINGIFNTVMKDPERTWMHPYDADALDAMHEDFSIEPKFAAELKDSAMFSFRNGIQQLITTLQQNLEDSNQVEFRLRTHVQDLKYIGGEEPQMQVSTTPTGDQTSTPELESYDLVLSSRRDSSLAPTVTVMTVNLFYPVPNLAPVTGFGYLIPQSVPFAQNPERALGVIFDSDAIVGQDTASGTKLTVMLGGHWWDGWESYPSEEEGVEMAKAVVERHLGIVGEPVVSHARLARDCIPQYTVGFDERLKAYAEKVKNDYRGRVRMVGNLYHGVGVNDCIRAAWSVACGLRGSGWRDRATGLERVSDVRDWTYYRYRE
jgi:oxygen-dependent protoporphyrinogen oxidase